ncbi:hypothetical protein LCGC14_1399290 [marine sediment metagenome]|uniref:Uncharacterized protein n=1 Tax=marine sediment metagenome TaxID=412755 RepID=A0A0F9MD36_9ZZZZ
MSTSEYQYITVAELESFMAITTAGLDSVDSEYTDLVVESKISQAERWVNTKTKDTFTGAVTDGVKYATLLMSKYFMIQQMVEDGYLESNAQLLKEIMELALDAVATDDNTGVMSISMQPPENFF